MTTKIEYIDDLPEITTWLSTGCTLLDLILADGWPGGVAAGRVIHLYGRESTGKTAIAQEIAGSALRGGSSFDSGNTIYLDSEATLDKKRTSIYGLDTKHKNFKYAQVDCIEDLFDKYIKSTCNMANDSVKCIVVDSIASVNARDESLEDGGYMNKRAKLLSKGFRNYNRKLAMSNVALVLVDQTRANIGAGNFAPQNKPQSGEAIKFYSTTKIKLDMVGRVKDKEHVIGIQVRATVEKNKAGRPFGECFFNILFDYGIDDITANAKYIIEHLGSIAIKGKKYKQVPAAVAFIEEHNMEKALQRKVIQHWISHRPILNRKEKTR